jgi:hypothetical protein
MSRRSWVALACTAALAAGCDRTPRFVPPESADTTAASVPADSTAIYVQMARERWESPESGQEAADLTSRIVLQELRSRPEKPLAEGARDLLDSLHLGAEVSGRSNFAVVNLFARSDPAGGSWPYVFWREGATVRRQALEAAGMRLTGALLDAPGGDPSQGGRLAALYARPGPLGPQPFVFVWQRPPGGTWRLQQSLGPDSLGSVGTARFMEEGEGGAVLVSRGYRPARGFDECATCPHLYRTRRFAWGPGGLVSVGEEFERSPYFTFVQLVHALLAGDRAGAERWVADPSLVDAAEAYEWGRSKGTWRVAPGAATGARDLLIFRGTREAYRVHFRERGDEWVVTGFEPTSRTID